MQRDYEQNFVHGKWAQAQVMPNAADWQVFANYERVRLRTIWRFVN